MPVRYCLIAICFLCGPVIAAGETRSAGRHEHGSTTLGIAVEGQSLVIESRSWPGSSTCCAMAPRCS
jgi:hypothetical protein